MIAREHELLAQVDERKLVAVAEHGLDGVRIEWAEIGASSHDQSISVMAGLVPAISLRLARCSPDRDRRVKPGDDGCG